jgi:hypothetical protein
MKILTQTFFIILAAAFSAVSGQTSDGEFRSGGGFRINLPKTVASSKEQSFNDGKLSGFGKVYVWNEPGVYHHQILYYKLDRNDGKALTATDKAGFLKAFAQDFLKDPIAKGIPFIEKEYVFNGQQGQEIQTISAGIKTIVRFFIAGQRFYFIGLTYSPAQDEARILQTLDSFALLDAKTLVAAKIEEATPSPLPQEPAGGKIKTDAADNNLKGRVKSVVVETQESPRAAREPESEAHYNEAGFLVRETSYSDGYPFEVKLWGYLDGNRVEKSGSISFDNDQRQAPPREKIATMEIEENPDEPRDARYGSRHVYKYDDRGRLVERQSFGNNGRLYSRTAFNYTENKREEIDFGPDGDEWSREIEIFDRNGDVVESYSLDEAGKPVDARVYAYELDARGNWIVQKAFEKKIARGKPAPKLLWTSYRTISYYP